MKCNSCNSEIQGPGYCPVCGSYNGPAPEQQMNQHMSPAVSPAMNQMPQQQIPSNTAMGTNPQPYSPKEEKPMNKKVVIGILCSVLAVAAVVVVILILTGGSKKINLNDYLNVEITGEYNGCTMVTDMLEKEIKDDTTGHRYKIVFTGGDADWDATSKLCQNEGGHLVTITSEEEQKLVEKLVDPSYISVYIGGYRGDDDRWHWVTGEDFTYKHWGTEDDYDNLITIDETHYWDSRSTMNAWNSEYYICEWDQ